MNMLEYNARFGDPEAQLKENIKNNTRHFSKRQITWFKREKDIEWINLEEFGHNRENVLEYMLNILEDKNIVA